MKKINSKTLDKTDIINFLSSNKKILRKEYNVKTIALFGSYARDEANNQSDIDLIIDMTEKDFYKLFFLKEFLQDHFKKEVNIITFDGVRTFIKREIQRDLIYA